MSSTLSQKIGAAFYRRWVKKRALKKTYAERILFVRKYLYGLSGIEIGGSGKRFGLDGQKGSYANVDIVDAATRAKNKGWKKSQLVNILSPGDDLPFNDEMCDYVFSSHVIEHFFDPVKAIEEWLRVVKKGGYVVMIIPHKERTFDSNREVTGVAELEGRHRAAITVRDYVQRTAEGKMRHETGSDKDHHKLIRDEAVPEGWERYKEYDFVHHWSVWDTIAFLELCQAMKWNVVEYVDTGRAYDNEFVVVLKKD